MRDGKLTYDDIVGKEFDVDTAKQAAVLRAQHSWPAQG